MQTLFKICKITFKIYIIIISLWVLLSILLQSIPKISYRGVYGALDVIFSLIALLGVILFVINKKIFPPTFWKLFTILYVLEDLTYNIYIEPAIEHKVFDPHLTKIMLLVSLPMYVSLVLYSYKSNKPI